MSGYGDDMSRDPLDQPSGGDARFESALGGVKHSAAYNQRKAAESQPRVDLRRLDAEYRRMLGVGETEPLPKSMGTTAPSSTGKGRRGRLVRKVKNKARNTTMRRAMENVR